MTDSLPTPRREYLCEVFDYDEFTGEFTWAKPTGNRVKVGDTVGTVNRAGYRNVKLNGGRYTVSRLIWKMMCDEEPVEVDHINNNRDDNRWINLRNVTHAENQLNRKDTKKNGMLWKDNPVRLERKRERDNARYHSLSPEQKREYNQACNRRRQLKICHNIMKTNKEASNAYNNKERRSRVKTPEGT